MASSEFYSGQYNRSVCLSRGVAGVGLMNRRDFCRGGIAVTAVALANRAGLLAQGGMPAWRVFEITTRVRRAGAARRHARLAADAARGRALPEDHGRYLSPRRWHGGDDRDQRQRSRHSRLLLGRRRRPGADSRQPRRDHRPRREPRRADRPPPADVNLVGAVSEADTAHSDRRHRQDDRERDHQGRRHRLREGAGDLRLDRRQHLPRSEDRAAVASATFVSCSNREILAANARISTRSSSVFAAPPAFPRATSTGCAWPAPSRVAQPRPVVGRCDQGAALPRRGLPRPATAGCRSTRRMCARSCSKSRRATCAIGRRTRGGRARAAVRIVGDELDRVQLRARRRRCADRTASRSAI